MYCVYVLSLLNQYCSIVYGCLIIQAYKIYLKISPYNFQTVQLQQEEVSFPTTLCVEMLNYISPSIEYLTQFYILTVRSIILNLL